MTITTSEWAVAIRDGCCRCRRASAAPPRKTAYEIRNTVAEDSESRKGRKTGCHHGTAFSPDYFLHMASIISLLQCAVYYYSCKFTKYYVKNAQQHSPLQYTIESAARIIPLPAIHDRTGGFNYSTGITEIHRSSFRPATAKSYALVETRNAEFDQRLTSATKKEDESSRNAMLVFF